MIKVSTKSSELKIEDKQVPIKRGRGRVPVDIPTFPRDPLSKVMKMAESIEKNNAGKPYDRLDLARSIDMSPSSGNFRRLITSSTRYGLTEGSYAADKISLTSLGSQIVAPTSDELKNQGLRNALLAPDIFRRVLEYFDKKQIPREELFKNTLKKEFEVVPEDVESCYNMLNQNMNDYGLIQDIKGNAYLQLNKLGSQIPVAIQTPEGKEQVETLSQEQQEDQLVPQTKPPEPKTIPRVFISHSKNKKILGQIKEMLGFGNFEHRIAEEKETAAIPIPEKVFSLMRECNCAIINVSADEEMKQDDDTYRINENVLIEIGGAFVYYNKRVILLVDKRLKLPSNLQGLYRCEYEGDELSWNVAMKLQKALTGFREKI